MTIAIENKNDIIWIKLSIGQQIIFYLSLEIYNKIHMRLKYSIDL